MDLKSVIRPRRRRLETACFEKLQPSRAAAWEAIPNSPENPEIKLQDQLRQRASTSSSC